jgi:DNA-binding XRE family transcriptional regulator
MASKHGKSKDKKHQEKAALLKQFRKDAGFTQETLAERLGTSRDMISHIENCHLQQISTFSTDLEDKWWEVCHRVAQPETRQRWISMISKKLGL